MNERIKLLADQAGYTEAGYESDDGPFVPAEFNKEKFAELIVKECMTVCADNACRAGGLNTQMGEHLYLATDLIKQHFGVEE